SLRQQAIAEEAQRRGMSINEMNALMTGQQVATPQMPQFLGAGAAQAPQLLAAAQAQGNFDQQGYQTGASMANALTSGIFNAIPTPSDRRLKKDIRRTGTSPSGIPTYTFKYAADATGQVYSGAMAQDLLVLGFGHAVTQLNGMLGVFYDLIDVECKPVGQGA
ncbi:MAG: hypothetical protein CL475_00165, partial [Acidobacteria bacterium]|nr:hypothetical protein [Acidobacteriota bacterium]